MEKLAYFTIQGRYEIYSSIVFNSLSTIKKQWTLHRAKLFRLQQCQEESFSHHVCQQVDYLRKRKVWRVCREIKLKLPRQTSVDFRITHFGHHSQPHFGENCEYKVGGLWLKWNQNIPMTSIFIKYHNWPLHYLHPFYSSGSVKYLGPEWNAENPNTNEGIII